MTGRVAWRRPRQAPITSQARMLVLRRLAADERYRNLSPTAQRILAIAVWGFMGGHGYFSPKRAEWADEANVCVRTITRATNDLAALGLVSKTPFHRPPGGNKGGLNGPCIYRLDPSILGPALLALAEGA